MNTQELQQSIAKELARPVIKNIDFIQKMLTELVSTAIDEKQAQIYKQENDINELQKKINDLVVSNNSLINFCKLRDDKIEQLTRDLNNVRV